MSHGPGRVEQRISELFAATKDRALSVADITDHAFALNGATANRRQRLSATRAAQRLLRRAAAVGSKSPAFDAIVAEARRVLGRPPQRGRNDRRFAVGDRWMRVDAEFAAAMTASADLGHPPRAARCCGASPAPMAAARCFPSYERIASAAKCHREFGLRRGEG